MAKINKSALQTKKIPTPLLSSKEFVIKDTFLVPPPDTSLIAPNSHFKYEIWPLFNSAMFIQPKTPPVLTDEKDFVKALPMKYLEILNDLKDGGRVKKKNFFLFLF